MYKLIQLPAIPEELYSTDINVIKKNGSLWEGTDPSYSTYKCSKELEKWIQSHFDWPVKTSYQHIHGQIPTHVDFGRNVCYNYIINTGSNERVYTRWYNDDGVCISCCCLPKLTWHELDVSIPHNVSYVDGNRLGITVQDK